MDLKTIYGRKQYQWRYESGVTCIDTNEGTLMLNDTARKIWELINGKRTVEQILETMVEEYKAENEESFIKEVTDETIEMLLQNGLIEEQDDGMFEGWIEYE